MAIKNRFIHLLRSGRMDAQLHDDLMVVTDFSTPAPIPEGEYSDPASGSGECLNEILRG